MKTGYRQPRSAAMKSLTKYAGILILTMVVALPSHAEGKRNLVQDQIKSALNDMVRDVQEAPTPEAKREIMTRFIDRAEQGASVMENIPFLSKEKHAAIDLLQGKFEAYAAELKGTATGSEGYGVADKDLNAFASFMQQDLEQADNGGIYLSTGAVIIILLILILIT
jgi:hypothetical protein